VRRFLITLDVEDWFQVENLRPWNPYSVWDRRELRVEANVNRLLDLFDSFKLPSPPASRPRCCFQPDPVDPVNPVRSSLDHAPCTVRRGPFISATFFVLGWLAERLPGLVREIAARGHEVASHGRSHRLCRPLADAELRAELGGSKRLLEDITGAEAAGFRAPNFSVDDRVLALIREAGYRYDSSYNSFSLHGRYGRISLNGGRMGLARRVADDFFELPVSNLPLSYLSTLGTSPSPGPAVPTSGSCRCGCSRRACGPFSSATAPTSSICTPGRSIPASPASGGLRRPPGSSTIPTWCRPRTSSER
jgi:hypothetical protein